MEHPYGEQYSQEGNPRAYMTMRDYRGLPYQWQQPVERNPSEYRSMRDYRDQWMSSPYGSSYNHSWGNHTNSSWEPRPPQYDHLEPPFYASTPQSPQSQQPPPLSLVEQALLNLSKQVDNFIEEQRVVTVQANQETETVESSLNKVLDGFQSKIDQKLDILQESISKLTNQFVHQEEENLEEECLTETILVEQAQLQPQEELKMESVAPPEELQDTLESGDTFWPWKKEEQTSALISEEESQEEECLSDTMVGEQCQQHLLLEPSDIGATVCPWENHTALLSEEINGKEPGEVPKKNIIQPNPIDLDTTATAQDTKYPLPVAPSVDQVYILPSPAPQPTPATKSKPAAPAPKAKSNPLYVMQNFKELVATVQASATTSKKMAAAYIAWHSGWFGCEFGFGTPGPRHF